MFCIVKENNSGNILYHEGWDPKSRGEKNVEKIFINNQQFKWHFCYSQIFSFCEHSVRSHFLPLHQKTEHSALLYNKMQSIWKTLFVVLSS